MSANFHEDDEHFLRSVVTWDTETYVAFDVTPFVTTLVNYKACTWLQEFFSLLLLNCSTWPLLGWCLTKSAYLICHIPAMYRVGNTNERLARTFCSQWRKFNPKPEPPFTPKLHHVLVVSAHEILNVTSFWSIVWVISEFGSSFLESAWACMSHVTHTESRWLQ